MSGDLADLGRCTAECDVIHAVQILLIDLAVGASDRNADDAAYFDAKRQRLEQIRDWVMRSSREQPQ